MIDHFFHRGVSFLRKFLIEGQVPRTRSIREIGGLLGSGRIYRPAVLWDGATDILALVDFLIHEKGLNSTRLFTFSLSAVERGAGGWSAALLEPGIVPPDVDGWIVASGNPLDQSSLCGFLSQHGIQDQILVNLTLFPETTAYYSYVDFLGGETRSLIHINNYLKRCYGYPFPIALKITYRNEYGEILEVRQAIVSPDHAVVLDNSFFNAKADKGYLEVEFEIHRKVNPFLHYLADYFNEGFIYGNHQSGLGLHPAGSRFTRGYIPTAPDQSLEVCLFQRNYANPPAITGTVHYLEDGERKSIRKHMPELAKQRILWVDVKSHFPEIPFESVQDPYIEVESDVPLHRPNYYYSAGKSRRYFDASHAGADLRKNLGAEFEAIPEVLPLEKSGLQRRDSLPFDLRFFVFPDAYALESLAGIGNDSTLDLTSFLARVFDENGKLKATLPLEFLPKQERLLNLSAFLKDRVQLTSGGSISLAPSSPDIATPILMNAIAGILNRKGGYPATTAANGSSPDNLPFYFRGGSPNYLGRPCTYGVTEIFARGVRSSSFDTFYAIMYPSASARVKRPAVLEIQILSPSGTRKCLQFGIDPNGCRFFRLSQLLSGFPDFEHEENFTVWFTAFGAHLYGQHVLYRKADAAVSLEHCYVGKFGY